MGAAMRPAPLAAGVAAVAHGAPAFLSPVLTRDEVRSMRAALAMAINAAQAARQAHGSRWWSAEDAAMLDELRAADAKLQAVL